MYKTQKSGNTQKITVDIDTLQELLGLGKNSAAKIGEASGSVVRYGKRKLYFLPKVYSYMESLTENESEERGLSEGDADGQRGKAGGR